jgi:asparagine synthase (glutamine-hydrolysing)
MPVFEWLKADLKEIVNELLDENYVANQGLLNVRYVSKMKQDYFSGKKINAQKLWQLLSFQLWYRQWM